MLFMEQRAEVRFGIDQPVEITLLEGEQYCGTARVKNVSQKGVQLEVDRIVPIGSPLKIEVENAMALGEVMYCQVEGKTILIGVKLEHVINGLAELSRVLMEFTETPVAERREQLVQPSETMVLLPRRFGSQ